MPTAAVATATSPLWFATRATGLIALVLLTGTVVLGIVTSVPVRQPGLAPVRHGLAAPQPFPADDHVHRAARAHHDHRPVRLDQRGLRRGPVHLGIPADLARLRCGRLRLAARRSWSPACCGRGSGRAPGARCTGPVTPAGRSRWCTGSAPAPTARPAGCSQSPPDAPSRSSRPGYGGWPSAGPRTPAGGRRCGGRRRRARHGGLGLGGSARSRLGAPGRTRRPRCSRARRDALLRAPVQLERGAEYTPCVPDRLFSQRFLSRRSWRGRSRSHRGADGGPHRHPRDGGRERGAAEDRDQRLAVPGGVAMTASSVTLGPAPALARYAGHIVVLAGSAIQAAVSGRVGAYPWPLT